MMLSWKSWSIPSALLVLLATLAPGVSRCQEDVDTAADDADTARVEPVDQHLEADDEQGRLLLQIGSWIAQPTGLGYAPATHLESGGFRSLRTLGSSTDAGSLAGVGFRLPNGNGSLTLDYFGHTDELLATERRPGSFIYGTLLVHPLFAGFRNDGLADGYDFEATTRTRDWSLRYNRTAFTTPSMLGSWHIGWRRLTHGRSQEALYYTLINDLPPLPPGRDDLQPLPDFAAITSRFSGRGLEAGFDLEVDLIPRKLEFTAGVSAAVLRGKTDASYTSLTSYYVYDLEGERILLGAEDYDRLLEVVDPGPPPIFLYDLASQVTLPVALRAQSVASSSHAIDAEVALRYRPRPWMEVFGGFRNTYYDGVGLDLRAKATSVTFTEFGEPVYNLQDVDEVRRSATYEGFFVGLSFFVF